MMLTLLVAQLVVYSAAPPLSPADAAAVLARLDSTSNWTNRFTCGDCDGPRVTLAPYRPGEGPFGPFPVYEFAPLNCCSFYQMPIYQNYQSYQSYQRARNRIDRYPLRVTPAPPATIYSASRDARRSRRR